MRLPSSIGHGRQTNLVEGVLRLGTSPSSASRRPLVIDGEDFGASVPKFSRGKNLLLKSLSFADCRELLSALCHVMKVIAKYSDSTLSRIQYKKLVMHIRRTIDDVGSEYISDDHLEVRVTCAFNCLLLTFSVGTYTRAGCSRPPASKTSGTAQRARPG